MAYIDFCSIDGDEPFEEQLFNPDLLDIRAVFECSSGIPYPYKSQQVIFHGGVGYFV